MLLIVMGVGIHLFLSPSTVGTFGSKNITDMDGRVVEVPTSINNVVATSPPMSTIIYMLAPDKLKALNFEWTNEELAYDYIPRELLERPKVGFSVPLDKWLRGPLKEQLLDYCNQDFLVRQDIFKAEEVQRFIKKYLETGDMGSGTGANYSRMVWAYFVFQKWYGEYM